MRWMFAAWIWLAVLACRLAAGGDISVVIREQEAAWLRAGMGARPLFVEALADEATELRLVATIDDESQSTASITVPARRQTRYEGFLLFPRASQLAWYGAEQSGRKHLSLPSGNRALLDSGSPPPAVCVNGIMARELQTAANVPVELEIHSIAADFLPGYWQAYFGFVGLLVLDAKEITALREPQREALVRWVRWLGGRVWLVGANAREAAVEAGLLAAGDQRRGPGAQDYGALNGKVYLQDGTDAGEMLPRYPLGPGLDPLFAYYRPGNSWHSSQTDWLLDGLDGMSTRMLIAVLAVLGLVMGPLNYFYIRRRGNSLLFFITTPLIALAGTLAILATVFLGEGIGGACNRHAVLLRGESGGEAMLFDLRGVRSGLFPPTLRFDADSLPLPLEPLSYFRDFALDTTDGMRLERGWLKSRFSTAFLVTHPAVCRMDLEVVGDGGEIYLVNGLGYTVNEAAVRLPDGGYGWAETIPPGGRVKLQAERSSSRLDRLVRLAGRFADGAPFAADPVLAASCSGLPYLQDGGMNARLLAGDYYYVRTASSTGERP